MKVSWNIYWLFVCWYLFSLRNLFRKINLLGLIKHFFEMFIHGLTSINCVSQFLKNEGEIKSRNNIRTKYRLDWKVRSPAGIHLLKVYNRNTITRCELGKYRLRRIHLCYLINSKVAENKHGKLWRKHQ